MGLEKLKSNVKLKLNYSQIDSGPFSTELDKLEVDDLPVGGDLTVNYSPISLFTRSISVTSKGGAVNGSAKLSEKHTSFDLDINPAIINSLTKEAELAGKLTIKGEGSPSDMTFSANISSEKIGINTPIGRLDFTLLNAELYLEKNNLTIKRLTSQDDMALDLNGTISLNYTNPETSVANINGTVNFLGGVQKQITLKGRLNNIQPSIR